MWRHSMSVQFLCVIPCFQSAPVARGRIQMCVFFFTVRRRRRGASEPITTARGRVVCGLLWIWKMDNLPRTFIIHIPTGRPALARWIDWQMPGRGVKRKITREGKSVVRHPVRASSLSGRSRSAAGIVLGDFCCLCLEAVFIAFE